MSTTNGKPVGEKLPRLFTSNDFFQSMLLSRSSLAQKLDPQNRDLDKECGYPTGDPTADFYRKLYDREGPATRTVGVYPDECWSVYPEMYQTEKDRTTPFEREWQELEFRLNPWHYLHRVDELSGIGHYGVLVLGLDDNRDPSEPVEGIDKNGEKTGQVEHKLLYFRVFPEDLVKIDKLEDDTNSARYGQPVTYDIVMADPSLGTPTQTMATTNKKVHWSRVIHVADNRKSSEVWGTPRMKPVLNRLMDIRKILGGSGEMFWRGAFPGYSFEAMPEMVGDVEMDEDTIKEQYEAYSNGLKRYLALTGVTARSLAPQIADPGGHLDQQFRALASSLGVPVRIFLGSESGHLASTQDTSTWNRRLARRQNMYLTPLVIYPFVDRLLKLGILPPAKRFYVSWRDLNSMTDKEKADVSLKKTQALMQYVTGGVETILPPKQFLTTVLGMTLAEVKAVEQEITRLGSSPTYVTEKIWGMKALKGGAGPQGGGRSGNAGGDSGRPAGSTPK